MADPIQILQAQANAAAGMARQALDAAARATSDSAATRAELLKSYRELEQLRGALSRVNVQAQTGDPNIQRIENIPGRRVPFDFLVEIPFNASNPTQQQQIITIDQSGPFIAVARFATFISTYQFRYIDPATGNSTLYNGRSYGRQRPIHSVGDLNDGQPFNSVQQAQAFPGTGAPHIASPSNQATFRSMEMDFRIAMQEQGSSIRRQNIPVASALWVRAGGDAFQLGALDFFERSQVISFEVQPLHVPNPDFGNISGFTGPGSDWPFLASAWDAIEGISDPAITVSDDTDPITRIPQGVLQIGFHGYRILQPPGPGQY
jgi:hypothetical protein